MATLGLVPPSTRPLLPGEEEDPTVMPEAAPPEVNAVAPGQGAGAPAGDSAASALAAALTPPATVDTTMDKGSQTNRTTTETTPEIDKGLEVLGTAGERERAANATIADESTRLAQEAADAADKRAALAAELADRRAQKIAEDQKLVDAAMADEKRRRAAMDAASTMHSFWGPENRGAPARIFAHVMASIADYAHLRAGGQGPSIASEYIEGEIAKDRQNKLDAFTRAKDFQQLAAKDVDHARDVLADHLRQLDAEGQVQRDKLTAMLEAQLARSKIPMASAEAQKLRAASDAKTAESEVKTRETFAAKVAKEGARRDVTHTNNTGNQSEKGKGDVSVFDVDTGKPTRVGRSFDEAKPLRDQYAALDSARQVAARLAERNEARGRFPTLSEQQLDTTIGNLLEKKKAITGALNESDEARIKAKLKAGIIGGSESANAALNEFMQGMTDDLRARTNAQSVAGEAPAPAAKEAPKPAQKRAPAPKTAEGAKEVMKAREWLRDNPKAPANQRARIQEWIRSH